MNELALFAGAGGGILASRLLGWRVVCAVEIDPYCREVLLRRQEEGHLEAFPIWDDVRSFDGKPWRGRVDIVSGGFPCQPFSVAGKRAGEDDSRNMWPETIRVIREVGPRFCLLENVPGLLAHEYFGTILGELAESGYDARWRVLSAAELGAPHKRDRLWIVANREGEQVGTTGQSRIDEGLASVAHSSCDNRGCRKRGAQEGTRADQVRRWRPPGGREVVADSTGRGAGAAQQPGQGRGSKQGGEEVADARRTSGTPRGAKLRRCAAPGTEGQAARVEGQGGNCGRARWPVEPSVGRVANGVAYRVDRLRALGNGQVPAVARAAWELLTGE